MELITSLLVSVSQGYNGIDNQFVSGCISRL